MEQMFNIPLSKPDITQKEIDAVVGVLKTSHLSLGQMYKEFQQKSKEEKKKESKKEKKE